MLYRVQILLRQIYCFVILGYIKKCTWLIDIDRFNPSNAISFVLSSAKNVKLLYNWLKISYLDTY